MTPYGTWLRFYRELRGFKQADFAARLGTTNKVLSAVETGRRNPHDSKTIECIKSILDLSDEEYANLKEAAENSALVVRIPRDTSPERIALVHQLVSRVTRLRNDKIAIIRQALANDEKSSLF
jgi:transcriptional regulator with XRE-family HTH domain